MTSNGGGGSADCTISARCSIVSRRWTPPSPATAELITKDGVIDGHAPRVRKTRGSDAGRNQVKHHASFRRGRIAALEAPQYVQKRRRGAWIEYDGIGSGEDADTIANIHRVLDAGFGRQLMLSQDRGWFDPAQPGGGIPKPYTYLSEVFLPKLRDSGVDEGTIAMLTQDNPFRAFAR